MTVYLLIKTLHILSATILMGSGIVIAFYMLMGMACEDRSARRFAFQNTVLVDYMFTLPSAIVQPITGFLLIKLSGIDWKSGWLTWSYFLYVIIGLAWIPVVFIQIRLRDLVMNNNVTGNVTSVNREVRRLYLYWFVLGGVAFSALIAVFFLMVVKYP